MVSLSKIPKMVLANQSDNVMQLQNVRLEWNQDTALTVVMEVIFNEMGNNLLSKQFRVAKDCHGSEMDAKQATQ